MSARVHPPSSRVRLPSRVDVRESSELAHPEPSHSPDDTTNLVASYDDSQTVTLGHDSAYGQSGKNWDTWSGTYIRGLEKCMSAQWDDQLGVDHAAVSYACKVGGSSDGSDSLEVAKQFWKLVPCGSDGSDDNDDDSSAVQFNAASSSGSAKAANAKFVQASSSDDDSSASSTSSASTSTQSVDPKDRSTWVCRHEGKWCVAALPPLSSLARR